MSSNINLLSFSKGSGCGCKINPTELKSLIGDIVIPDHFPGLVVGNSLADDCSVFDLGNGKFLLQTVDFFTPIVNDAYIFGAAAAANSLSDIWAMGGKPIMANAVFSWPLDKLPLDLGKEVLQGASDVCNKAGVALAGGHSIDGQEPLFGLSVTGICNAENLKRNNGAQNGDFIYLTKPLGIGMLSAAHKRGVSTEGQDKALFNYLQELNQIGESLGEMEAVHAITDVTGFGLAGHLLEMCTASGLGAEIEGDKIPKIAEAETLASQFILPDNAMRNWNAYEKEIVLQNQVIFPWLVDPQTNGGLLLAVDPLQKEIQEYLKSKANFIGIFSNKINGLKVN
ncbi:MAG: selenide, water dikinase SelD [Bacteroidetes bacterium]|nr:selenide, water dikinase SelD [Bacteroidota bacterium]